MGTQDQYPVGVLYGKYKDRTEYLNHHYMLPGLAVELSGSYWDVFLPLQGQNSIVHRALVLQRYVSVLNVKHGSYIVCGNLKFSIMFVTGVLHDREQLS